MTRRTEQVKIGKQKTRQLPDLIPQYRYGYKCSIIWIVKTSSFLWDTIPFQSTIFHTQNCHLGVGSIVNHYPAYTVEEIWIINWTCASAPTCITWASPGTSDWVSNNGH